MCQKIMLYLAIVCIGSSALFLGVPVISKEKVEQLLKANNQNVAAEVLQTQDEQS
jgi:hypothetical protein